MKMKDINFPDCWEELQPAEWTYLLKLRQELMTRRGVSLLDVKRAWCAFVLKRRGYRFGHRHHTEDMLLVDRLAGTLDWMWLVDDEEGCIALRFNELVREGKIGPVMMDRDHHDVSGTDSPFRETSNIKDGSNVMADMAVQCFAGNAARGMSLCALHNGGGVGIGKAINGGFGLLLDGSERTVEIIRSAMMWDVMGGVARRNWARNENALSTAVEYNRNYAGRGHITIPYLADDDLVDKAVEKFVK